MARSLPPVFQIRFNIVLPGHGVELYADDIGTAADVTVFDRLLVISAARVYEEPVG
jgi:hypothetical protein